MNLPGWLTARRRRDRPRDDLGAAGERAAAAELRRRGHAILERRYRAAGGEVDLVAHRRVPWWRRLPAGEHRDRVVFVEVKTRRATTGRSGAADIDRDKERRIGRAARAWLASRGLEGVACRFDVAVVTPPEPGERGGMRVEILEDAFRV